MRVVAALCWFQEPPEFLRRLILSLDGIVDEVVTVDGRWRYHDDGTFAVSSRKQTAAIVETTAEIGMVAKIVSREIPWESQVRKRDWMIDFAGDYGDWVFVVDGDTYLESFDSGPVRELLEQTGKDVAEVTVRNLNRPFPYRHLAPQQHRCRLLYRSGTRVVGPAHNDYARAGLRLNGDPAQTPLERALDLTGLITIAHDNRNRGDLRNAAAAAYRRARRVHQVEARA